MDCSPLDSSVHGIFQERILERFAISFSRGSSQPRDRTRVFCTASRFFTSLTGQPYQWQQPICRENFQPAENIQTTIRTYLYLWDFGNWIKSIAKEKGIRQAILTLVLSLDFYQDCFPIPSQTYPETKLPAELLWAADAVYLRDHVTQTLEREAHRPLSTDIETNTSSSSPWLPPRRSCEYPQPMVLRCQC